MHNSAAGPGSTAVLPGLHIERCREAHGSVAWRESRHALRRLYEPLQLLEVRVRQRLARRHTLARVVHKHALEEVEAHRVERGHDLLQLGWWQRVEYTQHRF